MVNLQHEFAPRLPTKTLRLLWAMLAQFTWVYTKCIKVMLLRRQGKFSLGNDIYAIGAIDLIEILLK